MKDEEKGMDMRCSEDKMKQGWKQNTLKNKGMRIAKFKKRSTEDRWRKG